MQTKETRTEPKKRAGRFTPAAKVGKSDNFIFIVCFLLAALFWLLIKLSAEYTITYPFKVSYYDIPVDKKMTSVTDSTVNISLTANGFNLLRLSLTNNLKKLEIGLTDLNLTNENEGYYKISSIEVKKNLSEELGIDGDDILFSKPFFGMEMENLYSKKIGVKGSFSIKFKEQYNLYQHEIVSPEKVEVFGPKSIIDTMKFILTENIKLNMVDAEQTIMANLKNPLPKLLRFNPDQVRLTFKVEKFTESSIEVPIDISGIVEEITIFPKTVTVSFKIAQKDFNNIEISQFKVIPETTDQVISEVSKLKLIIEKKPDFIRDEWLTPAEVEFLIVK